MKKVEAIIAQKQMKAVKDALQKFNYGITISYVEGRGIGKKAEREWRGRIFHVDAYPKVKIEIVALDKDVDEIVKSILESARRYETKKTGEKRVKRHCGKIFVSDVREVIRISTGKTGDEALLVLDDMQ